MLYVECGRVSRELLGPLEDDGFDLVAAESGTDAIRRLSDERVDAVVVPADLPGMDLDGFTSRATAIDGDVHVVSVGEPSSLPRTDVVQLPGSLSDEHLRHRVRTELTERQLDRVLDDHRRLVTATTQALETAFASKDPDAVLAAVYDRLVDTRSYELVLVGCYRSDGRIETAYPLSGQFTPGGIAAELGSDFLERAIESNAVTVAAGAGTARTAAAADAGQPVSDDATAPALSVAAVPIAADERTLGLLLLGTKRRDAFSSAERSQLDRLGTLTGRALDAADMAARLNEQSDRLEGIVHSIAHEIRNPLQVAAVSLELAREGDDSALDSVEHALERIERALDATVSFVHGRELEEVSEVDLGKLALSVWEDIETGGAELSIARPPTVEGDSDLIERLLTNVLWNAVNHGGPDVSVRVGSLDDDAGFYVEDDGPGIPAERRDEVLEWGVAGESGGTGIGLGVVREVCRMHGWDVEVVEGRDGGARFEIRTGGRRVTGGTSDRRPTT